MRSSKRGASEQRAASRDEPEVQEQEQSANTIRWAIAKDEPGVREHESEQRAAAREEPGVRELEQSADTVRRAIARDEPGVQEHESEQWAEARDKRGLSGASTWRKLMWWRASA